tara:strand:- start:6849 stop:7127 length:279 start_codon:yes stop_codon:yes gene_type:complete
MILKLSLLNFSLLLFFFVFTKVMLSSYRKKPLKYMQLQIQYFAMKLLFSSFLVFVFCFKNEDLLISGIISSLTVFVIYHIIEGFIFQKILET